MNSSIGSILRKLSMLACAAALFGCATTGPAPAPEFTALVLLGENGAVSARVMIEAASCPAIEIDGRNQAMRLRAGAATIALRPTHSPPEQSKPAAFPVQTCEATLPPGSVRASVLGRALALPKAALRRIVVIGDTGCRLKTDKKDGDTFQDCNDPEKYPFATVAAAAAAWKPDLVVHVGDYLYRENACPPGKPGCAGSPWGFGWDAWKADFFEPGKTLLAAAPWVFARGNHELCDRGGQGFWRFLDARALQAGRDCDDPTKDALADQSDPFAVPLGGDAQLIVFDTANTPRKGLTPADPRYAIYGANYRGIAALAKRASYNIGVDHHPMFGFGASEKAGKISLHTGDKGLIDAFGAINPGLLPANMQVLLSGHVHLWEQVSFSSAHPTQFVAGFSGTDEDIVPLPAAPPPGLEPAPGAVVEHLSSWIDGFGFMTMERAGADRWHVAVWDKHGQLKNTCEIDGRKSVCAQGQVK